MDGIHVQHLLPVAPIAFLSPNLTFQFPPCFLDYSLAILFDVFGSLYHPLVCKGVLEGTNYAISDIFRKIFRNTEDT